MPTDPLACCVPIVEYMLTPLPPYILESLRFAPPATFSVCSPEWGSLL